MKRTSYIVFLVCALHSVFSAPAFSQDYARMSERSIMGTARYVGMGGAMSAIGGDPSATFDNPAGLGLYRRTELMLTFDETLDYTRQTGVGPEYHRRYFMAPQASLIFSLPTYSYDDGVQFNNLSFSYRRLHTYNRAMRGAGQNDASLGALIATQTSVDMGMPYCTDPTAASSVLTVYESGYVNEFAFDWALNISNRWYVGAGLHLQSYFLASDGEYQEYFTRKNEQGVAYYNLNSTALTMSGASCNASLGLLYRPLSWLRLGFGLQTPSLGSLNTHTKGTLTAQTDSLRASYAPDGYGSDRQFHMPLHLSSSLAFQVGAYGLLALQYDYFKQSQYDAVHSLRAGLEVIPVLGFYINAGYVYESTFKNSTKPAYIDPSFNRQDAYSIAPRWSQYASVALGYRGTHVMVQAAYQYRWQQFHLYAHEEAAPYDMRANTHRIILTIGWHRN